MLFQCLQEGDLSEGARRDALLFAVEFYVLDCHCVVVLVDCLEHAPESALTDLTDLAVGLNFFHLNIDQNNRGK